MICGHANISLLCREEQLHQFAKSNSNICQSDNYPESGLCKSFPLLTFYWPILHTTVYSLKLLRTDKDKEIFNNAAEI